MFVSFALSSFFLFPSSFWVNCVFLMIPFSIHYWPPSYSFFFSFFYLSHCSRIYTCIFYLSQFTFTYYTYSITLCLRILKQSTSIFPLLCHFCHTLYFRMYYKPHNRSFTVFALNSYLLMRFF